jgi:Cu+-exporting ATPase
LRSAAGVKDARMDLTTGIASVIGQVEPNDLVEALDRVGFPATVINN